MPASVVPPPAPATGPHLRVLQCFTCRSMEELPDFGGRPDDDVLLHIADHHHGGHEEDPVRIHDRALHRVPEKVWTDPATKRVVVEQMWSGVTGFTPAYYDTQNNFREDALTCFSAHLRPEGSCPDYCTQPKRLTNPAAEMRRYVGLDPKGGPKVYLCSFCPVHSYYSRRNREG